MRLSGLDFFFWVAGFAGHAVLLFILWFRRRAGDFPYFTALITLGVTQTIVFYVVLHAGTKQAYFYTYWTLGIVDAILQLGVVYELASYVFHPPSTWLRSERKRILWFSCVGIVIAFGLTWLASPPARTWMQSFATKASLFAAVLMSELFAGMMALAVSMQIPWRTHVANIAAGLGTYSLITVLIEAGHSYFGIGREIPAFIFLSHLRMTAYLLAVIYWSITLWRDQPQLRPLTDEMREKMFTLQARVDYDLEKLRSRDKL